MARLHLKVAFLAMVHLFVAINSVTTFTWSSEAAPGSWNVTELNTTCILLQAKISLSINYTDVYNVTREVVLDVPPTAQASGICGNANASQQTIILSWFQPNQTQPQGQNNTLTFEFHANHTRKNESENVKEIPLGKYALFKVSAIIHKNDPSVFPNVTNPPAPFVLEANNLALFPTTLDHSYACQSDLSVAGAAGTGQRAEFNLVLGTSQIEAFRKGKIAKGNGIFSAAEHCAADEISSGSIAGTIVGVLLTIVLIALGVAALVTYYMKRKKVQTGYENM